MRHAVESSRSGMKIRLEKGTKECTCPITDSALKTRGCLRNGISQHLPAGRPPIFVAKRENTFKSIRLSNPQCLLKSSFPSPTLPMPSSIITSIHHLHLSSLPRLKSDNSANPPIHPSIRISKSEEPIRPQRKRCNISTHSTFYISKTGKK